MTKVIWKDDAIADEKVGFWPFRITYWGRSATNWKGFDEKTGIQLHDIRAVPAGYWVQKRNGEMTTNVFMTLEHAQAYCENSAWPYKVDWDKWPHKVD